MDRRIELHNLLVNILGSRYVYFQPPETVKMIFPCIVYSLETIDTIHADDLPYMKNRAYSVIIIDKNPDSELVNKMSELKLCQFERHYTANNLNHWVFRIYF